MPCDHLGPPEVIELAERELSARGVAADQWGGTRVRHAENTPDGMWGSVVIEIERRDGQWIVTRLDRNREPIPRSETGLHFV